MACDKGVTFIARMIFAIYGPQIGKNVQLNTESEKKSRRKYWVTDALIGDALMSCRGI